MAVVYTGVGSRNGPVAGTGNSLTLTGNVAAGDLVVVVGAIFNKLDATSTLTDTKGNVYRLALVLDGSAAKVGAALSGNRTGALGSAHPFSRRELPFRAEQAQAAGNLSLLVFYAVADHALASGVDSVTMTYRFNGQLVQNTDFSITALDVSGLPNPVLDAIGSGVGFGTAASSANVTTQVGNEAMIGAFAVNGPALDSFTSGGGWTTTGRAGGGGEINTEASPQTQTATAPGSFAAAATLGIARLWVAGIVTFRTGDAYGIVRGPEIRGSLARQQLVRPFEGADRYTDAQAPPAVLADLVAALQSRSTSHWRVWRIKNRPADLSWLAPQVAPEAQGRRQSRRLAGLRRRAAPLPTEQLAPPIAIGARLRRLLRRQPRRSDLTLAQAPPNPWQVVASFNPVRIFRRYVWRRPRMHDEPALMPQQAATPNPPILSAIQRWRNSLRPWRVTRRGRFWEPGWGQAAAVAPAFVAWWRRARAYRSPFTVRRKSGPVPEGVALQQATPVRRRKFGWGRRPRRVDPISGQTTPVNPPFVAWFARLPRAWRLTKRGTYYSIEWATRASPVQYILLTILSRSRLAIAMARDRVAMTEGKSMVVSRSRALVKNSWARILSAVTRDNNRTAGGR